MLILILKLIKKMKNRKFIVTLFLTLISVVFVGQNLVEFDKSSAVENVLKGLSTDISESINEYEGLKVGVISFTDEISLENISAIEILSYKGDLKEAATNLYVAMHRLDKLNLDIIIAQNFPDSDLGRSINDRLIRATKNK